MAFLFLNSAQKIIRLFFLRVLFAARKLLTYPRGIRCRQRFLVKFNDLRSLLQDKPWCNDT